MFLNYARIQFKDCNYSVIYVFVGRKFKVYLLTARICANSEKNFILPCANGAGAAIIRRSQIANG